MSPKAWFASRRPEARLVMLLELDDLVTIRAAGMPGRPHTETEAPEPSPDEPEDDEEEG